ncbi:hypothetical protein AHAS_Ahas19G0217900 [Arachis hypogaea]
MWRLAHGRILTAGKKAKIIGTNPNCCPNQPETVLHAFRDFPQAAKIWSQLIQPTVIAILFGTNLTNWLKLNMETSFGTTYEHSWKDKFFVTCWWM